MHISFAPKSLPHDRLENTMWLDIKARGSLPAFILTLLLYSGIFLAGWNDHFPTRIEQTLWRVSSLSMMTAVALYFIITAFAYIVYPALHRYLKRLKPLVHEAQAVENSPQTWSFNKSLRPESKNASMSAPRVLNVQSNTRPAPEKKRSWLSTMAARLRNNSVSKDPMLDVPLKATIPDVRSSFFVLYFTYVDHNIGHHPAEVNACECL
ncbi:hypothetical protein BKA64DRAFT_651417 [Cadophora sp. MPI-SDFR-AT-0126]|nr:hypothetical protein BKA64DRAFT_651417 [Leotiomycetes sp. MPI-SDFR-AT-0126]